MEHDFGLAIRPKNRGNCHSPALVIAVTCTCDRIRFLPSAPPGKL
jgi:hypothetical protein